MTVVLYEVGEPNSSSAFPQACFGYSGFLCFHTDLKFFCSSSVKKMPLVTDSDCKAIYRLNGIPIKSLNLYEKNKIIVLNSQEPPGSGGGYTSGKTVAVVSDDLNNLYGSSSQQTKLNTSLESGQQLLHLTDGVMTHRHLSVIHEVNTV